MNVAIYYTPLGAVGLPTGVGKHIVHMAGALAADPAVGRVSLLANRKAYAKLNGHFPPELARLPVCFMPGSEGLMRRVQLFTRWLPVDRWADNVDWVYCPKEQPVSTKKARLAVMVHDVLALEPGVEGLPERSGTDLRRWRLTLSRILQRAHLIATASQFTARRMVELLGIKDDRRIAVVGNGVEREFYRTRQPDDSKVLRQYAVEPDTYLLLVGSLTYRKGGDGILSLTRKLMERLPGIKIVVSGRRHDENLLAQYNAAKAEEPRLAVELVGYVPDSDLAVLYSNALALLFPSRYEGFGIPVLEAMAAGAPVICSGAGALPEVAGDAALRVAPQDINGMFEAIKSLAESPVRRLELVNAGHDRARDYTWRNCAARLTRAMQSV